MAVSRIGFQRLLATGGLRASAANRVYPGVRLLPIHPSWEPSVRCNSTIAGQPTASPPPPLMQNQSSTPAPEIKSEEKRHPPSLEEIKEGVKKISKRIETRKRDKADQPPEPEVPSDESLPTTRKIKNAQRQRRQEDRDDRPQKNRAQKSLRRVGFEASLPREVFQELIQQAETKRIRAHSVAEALSFAKLRHLLGDYGYYPFTALTEECIHVTSDADSLNASQTGDIFFFSDGTIVTWGLAEEENLRLLDRIKPAEKEPYRDIEEETLDFIQDPKLRTGMMGDLILIGGDATSTDATESSIYAKLAFSNGIARSTKLAVLEEQLENYLDSTREIPRILAQGSKLPWGRRQTLQKMGELLAFRGELNLHSELVETPDLYWAKPQLEDYYNRISKNLDVAVRITILNKKLDYANELAATLRSHLSEKHGLALEWGIIGLIAIEVLFGIIELVK